MNLNKTFAASLIALLLMTTHETPATQTAEGRQDHSGQILSIKLKVRSIVLGPEITLGDVSHIIGIDDDKRKAIGSIQVGEAPPPGEATEIELSHIKRCLQSAGFKDLVDNLKGPRTVRVVTAHKEIDKAFIREVLALQCEAGFERDILEI